MPNPTTRDPWAQDWQLHEDPKKILSGIKDRKFTLKLLASQTKLDVYGIEYTKEFADVDPFLDTQFVRFGKDFPDSPSGKLKKWTKNEERHYKKLIDDTFDNASANLNRLIGEKEVDGKKELVMLLLIPDAIDTETNISPLKDLIYVVCSLRTVPSPSVNLQDGTAHGNPK